jgi:PKD repeat protein
MGVVSCVIPVSASVFTINPGTGNVIQSAINSASSGDTIVLNPGTYSENGITITGKNLILRAADGHGPSDTIIDGKSTAPRIFTVTDTSSLTIENLALRNGRAGDAADCGDPFISLGNECGDGGYGGAIYSGGNVTLKNSTITDSKAGNGAYGSDPFLGLGGNGGSGGHGGAIYATGAVTLTSSSISGCFGGDAGDGGEDDPFLGGEGMGGAGGSGGAIFAMGTITLVSSNIMDSHAGNGGTGAYQKVGFASAGGSGGAIYGSGVVTLVSSTISGCSAGTGGAGGNDNWGYDGGNGGAISAGGAVTITSSTISGCSAGDGGAGGPGDGSANMGSWGGDGGAGGALFSNGPVTITSSTIEYSKAGTGGNGGAGGWPIGHPADGSPGGSGGAIYSTSPVTLTSASITGCSAGSGGTGGEGFTVRDGGDGGTGGSGGAIYSTSPVTLGSSVVDGCSVGAGGAGGSGGFAADNGASGFPGNGGGISTGSSVTTSSSTFSSCYATYGGAVYAGSANSDSSVFTDCSALMNGGAVYAQSVMITSTTLEGCNAFLSSGGAVSADSGTIRFSRLVNNEGMVWFPPQYFTHYGDDITGSIDARYNWWGANSIVSSRVTEGVTYSPNLVLTVIATPPAIGKSKSSMIEANLTVDSTGTWHDPVYGHVPDGIPIIFAITSGPGSISPGSAVTADGVAQTTFTSSAVGTATVTATIDEQQVPVSIIVDPEARFTITDRSVVRQQQEAEFIDQSVSTLPLTYLWDFGDAATSTEQNPKHVYKKEGVYDITLTVTNAIGSDTLTKQEYVFVTSPNPIHANFVAVNKEGPSPLTVSFTDTSFITDIPGYPPLNSWLWDFGDGTNSNIQNPTHLYLNAGNYHVTLTVSNSVDSDSKTKDFIVVVPVKSTSQGTKKITIRLQ